ncbi:hypothetical protein OIE67_13985 [Nonomuraea fuscirosea]|uniref:hypothetical protein n=1 Tax=Nonomuraea fuscirosea TaxID=1291556 RepID=UPI002DDAA745|nr:hypothetical protein [Nonomuraea fuscirosea]WSA55663.1 hypothetical protein OIE67_13985 [Nonomuraea fuscirosea]
MLGSESAVTVDESKTVGLVPAPGDVEVQQHPARLRRRHLAQAPLRPDHPLHPDLDQDHQREQPFVSAPLLRGDPGVNVYQPFPAYVPGTHMPFAGAGTR